MRKSKVTLPPQPVGRPVGSVRQHSEELLASYGWRGVGGEWGGEWTGGGRRGKPLTEQRRIQLQPVQLRCCPLPIPTLRLHIQEILNRARPPSRGRAPYDNRPRPPHIPDDGLLLEPELLKSIRDGAAGAETRINTRPHYCHCGDAGRPSDSNIW